MFIKEMELQIFSKMIVQYSHLVCIVNQTIQQKDIYANFVRESIDIDINDDYCSILNDVYESLKFVSKKNSKLLFFIFKKIYFLKYL